MFILFLICDFNSVNLIIISINDFEMIVQSNCLIPTLLYSIIIIANHIAILALS